MKFSEEIIDSANEGIVVCDRSFNVLFWNSFMEKLTGKSSDEVLDRNAFSVFPLLREEGIDVLLQRALRGEVVKSPDTRCYTPGKETSGWSSGIYGPYRNERGNISGVICFVRDITERKVMEEALTKSEKKYRELVDNANSIILKMDSVGNVTFFNEFAQEFFGYTEAEIISKNVVGTIVPGVESTGRDLRLMIEDIGLNPDRYINNVNENMKSNGERVWIAWTNKPSYDEHGMVKEVTCIGNDITERRQAEEALRKSEENYRNIFENAVMGIFHTTPDGRYLRSNHAGYRMYGYESAEDIIQSVTDMSRQIYVHPEDRAKFREMMEREGRVDNFEVEHYCKDGRKIWTVLSSRTVKDDAGRTLHYQTTIEDITERKQKERMLEEMRRQQEALLNNIPDIAWMKDRQGRFIAVNEPFGKLCGFKPECIVGKTDLDIWPKDLAERYRSDDREVVESGIRKLVEEPLIDSEGKALWIETVKTPIYNGKGEVAGTVGIARDVTKRKQAEEALRESEERYRRITQCIPDAVWTMDLSGRFTYVNSALARMHDWTATEALERNFRDLVSPQQIAEDEAMIEDALAKMALQQYDRNTVYSFESEELRKDGTTFWADVSASFLWSEDGRPIGIIGITRDITERKRAEDSIRESEAKFRALADSSPSAIFLVQGTKFVYVNPAFSMITGYTIHDFAKMDFWDVVHPACRKLVKKRGLARMGGETPPPRYEIKILTKDGRKRWVDYSASVIDADNKPTIMGSAFDITERKRVEQELMVKHEELSAAYEQLTAYDRELAQNYKEMSEKQRALRESEERYRNMFDNALEGIYQSTPEGTFINVNPAMAKMCGYSSPAEMIESITDIPTQCYVDHIDREKFISLLNENRRADNIEFRVRRKDGNPIWVSVSARVVSNEQGDFRYYEGAVQNITDRKRVEDALRSSEEKFFKAFQASPGLMAIRSWEEGRLIDVNDAFINTSGYSREELIGKNPVTLGIIDPETGDRIRDMIREQGYIRNMEINFKTKASGIHTGLFSAAAIDIGDQPCFISATQDITERKEADKTLEAERERLASILDSIPIPAFMIDRNHNVVLWNRHNETYTDISKESVLGRPVDLSPLFQGKPSPTIAELVLEMADDELIAKFGKTGLRKSDIQPHVFESTGKIFMKRQERIVNIQATRITDPKGNVVGAVQTAQDVTARVKLELQLRHGQKMEAIGTLAGGIAHDFNNILTAIMGYTDLALDSQHMDNHQRHNLEQVYKAGERARDLVKQILAFSRQKEQEQRPIRIAPLIKEVMKLLRSSLPTTIEITQSIRDTSIIILADPTQIHQVLMNLCTNAAHAMSEKGGTLSIQLAREAIIESVETSQGLNLTAGDYAKLTISDTGHGIDAAIIDRIFDPFFTTKGPKEGTGLGLSVVYGIVRDHEGAIEVSSEPGKGTVATVYFPLAEAEAPEGERMPEVIPGGGEHILLVDDEEALVELENTMLTSLGYRVTARTSSIEALEAFRACPNSYDLVVTDMTMPNMRGDNLVRELLKIRPGIPIILCTGFSEMISEEKAKHLGVSEFIMKPINKKDIAIAIRTALKAK